VASLQRLRDIVLILGGLTYAYRYVTWAVFAHHHNLGVLPALDFQYFVAGLPPITVVAISGLAAWWINRSFAAGLSRLPFKYRVALGIGLWLLIFIGGRFWGERVLDVLVRSPWIFGLLFPGVLAIGANAAIVVFTHGDRIPAWVFPLIAAVTVVPAYASSAFSTIPQALGGGAPRCARLDVEVGTSEDIRSELMLGNSFRRDGETEEQQSRRKIDEEKDTKTTSGNPRLFGCGRSTITG
jgi:hypothetical protein